MSGDEQPVTAAVSAEGAQVETTPSGRYIPYSGGSAGWYENSGVLKSERRNNYRYYVEMDLPQVRGKQFLRWATEAGVRGGGSQREVSLNLVLEGRSVALTCREINERGLRLQVMEDLELAVGGTVTIEMLDAEGGTPTLVLDAEVISLASAGTMRQVWTIGLFFPNVTPEASAILRTMGR